MISRLVFLIQRAAIILIVLGVLLWAFKNPDRAGDLIRTVVSGIGSVLTAIGDFFNTVTS